MKVEHPVSTLASSLAKPPATDTDTIRVCIVDDAVVVRGMVSRWVGEEEGIEMVGSYRNGRVAVESVAKDNPHVIVLDIEMPEMDGLTALPLLLKACPRARIVMASTLTRRNAEISLKALSLGASDYVPKPETNSGVSTSGDFRRDLIEKIRALGGRAMGRAYIAKPAIPAAAKAAPVPGAAVNPAPSQTPVPAADGVIQHRPFSRTTPGILIIGSSTGGPPALSQLFSALNSEVWRRVPVLVTQHMPATFTAILAEHLTRASRIKAAEAVDGESVTASRIYVAPGGKHMVLTGTRHAPKIKLTDDAPVHFCKPAVDPLFESVVPLFGPSTLAAVLTGMGADGAAGSVKIADAGGTVLAQDKDTSVVWGMPGAVAQAGASAALLPIPAIAKKINELVMGARA